MIGPILLAAAEEPEHQDTAGYLIHHVQDGNQWELPGGPSVFANEYDLTRIFGSWKIHLGSYDLDLTPTKYTLIMWLGAIILVSTLLLSMRNRGAVPKGRLQTLVEIFFSFIKDEVAEKNIGHGYERYVPYLASVFFFIMTLNLIGLVPYSATATANLSLTGTLAILTFLVTQLAGMRAQGVVGYWTHLVPSGVPKVLYPIFIPIELVGLITKPFALMMRLFANMVAGHIVIYFLIGLIFFFHSAGVAVAAIPFALFVYLLEIFVALLQAYIFTILSAVFIGLAGHAH
jgi:F-type H+-transporting ATPase subunit a